MKKRTGDYVLFSLLIFGAIALVLWRFLPSAPAATKQHLAQLLSPRTKMATATWRGDVYLFGGSTSPAGALSLSPTGEGIGLRKTAHFPVVSGIRPRAMHTAQAYGPYVFLFGGSDGYSVLNDVERLDMRNGTITKMAPLPTPRRIACSVLYGSKIFVLGGADNAGGRLPTVEIYDIKTNKWQKAAPMPTPRECTSFVHGNKIYAVGGYQRRPDTGSLKTFEEYDPAKNTWTKLKALPYGLSAHRLVAMGDDVFSFGTFDQLDKVCSYNFKDGKWRTLKGTGYTPRRHAGIGTDGKCIVIAGGNDATGHTSADIQRFEVSKLRAIVSQTPPD